MLFKGFQYELKSYGRTIDGEVNEYLKEKESEGYSLVDKSVICGGQGDNSLIRPSVNVILWLDKECD